MVDVRGNAVIVVGAGLAGLSAARTVAAAGVPVTVLEAADHPGGRVRTDVVDGFRVDHGFQSLTTSWPQVARQLDVSALGLRVFQPGVLVFEDGRTHRIGDVRRVRDALGGLRTANGGGADRARVAALLARVASAPIARVLSAPEVATVDTPSMSALSPELAHRTLRPLLATLLHDPQLRSSSRFAELMLRSFLRGRVGLPARGMADIPRQLAAGLPTGVVRYGVRVSSISADRVLTDAVGEIRASAVIVATDPATAVALLPGLRMPEFHAVTTLYHVARLAPRPDASLLVEADGRSPFTHTTVVSQVAPTYSPDRRALVATTVLGHDGSEPAKLELRVRERLAVVYDTPTASWDHLTTCHIPCAVPVVAPGHNFRRPVRLIGGLYVCGDHRDSSSIQGALASGHRAARSTLTDLGLPQ
ncbi:NAD(P)/FAD-dependent oxidoreductase [Streptomyces sp. SID3343]|uniref:NAD(P)/FAD-dependent oxidoreductase n=1 Tax=Streptomyces sp. SID3343 TaxID=2690260 RepID=UPI0031F82FD1